MIQTIDFINSKNSQGRINNLIGVLDKEVDIKDIRTTFYKEFYHNQILIDCETPIIYEYDFLGITFYYGTTNNLMTEFTF